MQAPNPENPETKPDSSNSPGFPKRSQIRRKGAGFPKRSQTCRKSAGFPKRSQILFRFHIHAGMRFSRTFSGYSGGADILGRDPVPGGAGHQVPVRPQGLRQAADPVRVVGEGTDEVPIVDIGRQDCMCHGSARQPWHTVPVVRSCFVAMSNRKPGQPAGRHRRLFFQRLDLQLETG